MAKKNKLSEPSEEFKNFINTTGSISVDCELCGRTHFTDSEPNAFEEGELKNLMRNYKNNPDKYILHNDMISWGTIDGKQAVLNCSCNELSKYEQFILNHQYLILHYLHDVAEKELASAQEKSNLVQKIKDSIK